MGKIQKILDGFNNGTISEKEYIDLAGIKSELFGGMSYEHFKKISIESKLTATKMQNYFDTFSKTIENFGTVLDPADAEAVKYCTVPGNQLKRGCPCVFSVVQFIRLVEWDRINREKATAEWNATENARIAERKQHIKNHDLGLLKLKNYYDGFLLDGPAWCLHPEAGPVEYDPEKYLFRWNNNYCTDRNGNSYQDAVFFKRYYWQWYVTYQPSYIDKMIKAYERERPEELTFRTEPITKPRELTNQCCTNEVTVTNSTVFDIDQSCTVSKIDDSGKEEMKKIIEQDRLEKAALAEKFIAAKKAMEEKAAEEKAAAAAEEEAAAAAEEEAAAAAEEEAAAAAAAEEEAAAKKKKIIIIIIIIVLGVMGVSAFMYFSSSNELEPSSDASTI